ncbi:MAG: type 1 glutamine amidotransferase [Peptococcaceae bacterium]|nr:type 1 glutamine amidotransferase [Peptococcaceae bacterium]
MKAVLIQHQAEVPPGILPDVLAGLGWEAEVILMEEKPELPPSLEGFDCLVLLGGTMNVDDVDNFPYLAELRRLTATALEKGFPVLGLCLGAQMMARAAGSRVYRNRCGEIGWCQVQLTRGGLEDKVLAGIKNPIEVFHWHDDMFALPEKSVLLGKSAVCPNQVIRIGEYSYGFQFHPEVTEDIILSWTRIYHDEVASRLGPGGPAALRRESGEKISRYHRTCRRILTNYFKNIAP